MGQGDIENTVNGFAKVDFVQTKSGKTILQPMKVDFPPGSITGILGPSGSGKTTFLNFISGNMPGNLKFTGEVNLDGTMSMVPQDDRLHGFYNCESYLKHYTRLTGQTLDYYSRKKMEDLLADLGLTKSKHVRVGDVFLKGLSGGQKRRLSVALEANSNPNVFFLDEPTSGLDSESAYRVIEFLSKYAKRGGGRRVILTIHQPSSYLWELIDNVVLLAKGNLVYSGPRQLMETFFEVNGYPTPLNYNPADHYVTIVNDEFPRRNKEKISVKKWAEAFQHYKDADFEKNAKTLESQNFEPSIFTTVTDRSGGLRTTIELIRRYFLNLWFNPGILFVRVLMYGMLSLMLGALFWKLGEKDSFGSIQSRIALNYYVGAFFIFMSVAVLPFTVQEKAIVDKEVRNGYYHPATYQLAQAISSIPGVAILAGIGTGIIIGMTGLREGWWYFLNLFLSLFCAEALAQLVSHMVPHFIIGMALVAGMYGMFMLLEGFMLIPSEFPKWLRWAYNIAFHTYSWRSFMYKEFSSENSVFDSQEFPTGMDVLKAYEIEDVDPANDMMVLCLYGIILHLLSFCVLHWKHIQYKKRNTF